MMKVGIICPSEIALRRFMPALQKSGLLAFAGIGVFNREERFQTEAISDDAYRHIHEKELEKARAFTNQYGGKIFEGYETIIKSPEIDAIYIPLPPALHFKWARKALEYGKHVLVEKPATISARDTEELVNLARESHLALHENYMFMFHDQLDAIDAMIDSGEIGDVWLYRISFGFPRRDLNDFRYNKSLGGGALIDAGGYTIQYAARLLGPDAKMAYAQSNYGEGFEVDIFGSAAMVNNAGTTVQLGFGMDNDYKCDLEAWGSKGCLSTGRVLTAPAGFVPTATIRRGKEEKVVDLPSDDAFLKSIEFFVRCIRDDRVRTERYQSIIRQSQLVEEFKTLAGI